MEIGPEPRRPCDFPGQPAHQNGPRSRPMGMGRAFSCPFLGNSSAPRGAAGARSALKSPGGGFRPPPGDFRLAGSQGPSAPGSRQTPPPPFGRTGVPQGRKPSPPHPGRISQPAESVFQEGPQPETQPFAHVPGPLASNLWEGSAAPPGSGCPAWDGAGGAAAFGGPGAEGPGPAKQKERAPGPALLGRFAPCRRPPGAIPGRAALGFLQRRQGQKPQVFANELQGKGVAGGE